MCYIQFFFFAIELHWKRVAALSHKQKDTNQNTTIAFCTRIQCGSSVSFVCVTFTFECSKFARIVTKSESYRTQMPYSLNDAILSLLSDDIFDYDRIEADDLYNNLPTFLGKYLDSKYNIDFELLFM